MAKTLSLPWGLRRYVHCSNGGDAERTEEMIRRENLIEEGTRSHPGPRIDRTHIRNEPNVEVRYAI